MSVKTAKEEHTQQQRFRKITPASFTYYVIYALKPPPPVVVSKNHKFDYSPLPHNQQKSDFDLSPPPPS